MLIHNGLELSNMFGHAHMMSKQYRDGLVARTKQARVHSGLSPTIIAKYLDIPLATYTKYEGARSKDGKQTTIPDELKGPFAEITQINLRWLITGEGAMQARPQQLRTGSSAA
jgi:hypothetical protein